MLHHGSSFSGVKHKEIKAFSNLQAIANLGCLCSWGRCLCSHCGGRWRLYWGSLLSKLLLQRQQDLALCSLTRSQLSFLLFPRQPAGQGPSLELNLNASHSSACTDTHTHTHTHTHTLRQTTAQCLHPGYLVTKHACMPTPTKHLLHANELCLQLCLEVPSYIPRFLFPRWVFSSCVGSRWPISLCMAGLCALHRFKHAHLEGVLLSHAVQVSSYPRLQSLQATQFNSCY